MKVGQLIKELQKCDAEDKIKLIQEEELECMPEWWDDEKGEVAGAAAELYSEDLHSHQMYLLAIHDSVG